MRDAARDAHLVNYVAARAPFIRLLAGINLMELASLDGQETVFQEYRRELAEVSLPPALLPYYHLYVGEGCYRFRRSQCARVALDKAIVVATERQMNEVIIRAEAMLKRLEQGQVPEPVAQLAQTPAVLAEPVRVIRELRERIWAGAP